MAQNPMTLTNQRFFISLYFFLFSFLCIYLLYRDVIITLDINFGVFSLVLLNHKFFHTLVFKVIVSNSCILCCMLMSWYDYFV